MRLWVYGKHKCATRKERKKCKKKACDYPNYYDWLITRYIMFLQDFNIVMLLEFIEYISAFASEMGSFTRSPGTSLPALPQARLLRSLAGLYSRLVQFLFCGNVQVIRAFPWVSEVGENLMPSPISCQFWWLLLCCFILHVQGQSAKSLQEMGHWLRLEAVLSRKGPLE